MKIKGAFLVACFTALTSFAQQNAPDVIIVNATVRTMDPKQPKAEALAISGNKIVAVGSTEDIGKLAGKQTRRIDAGKKLVLPGFNDAHVHFMDGGFSLSNVDLRTSKSPQEFAKRIGDFAKKLPKGA